MYNPISTYRIQFNKEFTFSDLKKNADYFFLLDPATIYGSPVFESTPGSMHGYDGTDPDSIDPEIGAYAEFIKIASMLKSQNIGWMQDIVPNHMAFHMNNRWLMNVLEEGAASGYSSYFDIDFENPFFEGKLMVPFIGKEPEQAVNDGEIILGWINDKPVFRYFDFWFPLNTRSVIHLITIYRQDAPQEIGELLTRSSFEAYTESELRDLRSKLEGTAFFSDFVKKILSSANKDSQFLKDLLGMQHYRLCYWNDSVENINYRRFFTVNSLICLRMENDEVFENYHRFIERQVKSGRFNALRIDHIDGLMKPVYYLEKLRQLAGEETYIVAEKILGKDEELIAGIPVQGTSGYDFLGIVNNLLTYNGNYPVLERFYRKITGIKSDPANIKYEKKKFILLERMHGELRNLSRMFDESGLAVYGDHVTSETMKAAIAEFLILFPVYRIYSDHFPLTNNDRDIVSGVLLLARLKNPSLENSLKILEDVFLFQEGYDGIRKEAALRFFLRCMQFTGPLMAKGVEDTFMYYYNCFIAHNEVGDDAGAKGISINDFHGKMMDRREHWPMSMNATSTHDTKRGEDVRARLNILSEMPEEWMRHVKDWMKMNERFRKVVNNIPSPDVNEEYFIYQTLIGVFPFNNDPDESFMTRLEEYLIKSLREAKDRTDWNSPDTDHENAVIDFTGKILERGSAFLESFLPFQERVSNFGIINSLSQLMLKATCPGIPDFYQGTELWDLSMVDPDNRRAVDYDLRLGLLKEISVFETDDPEQLFLDLFLSRTDGRIKLWLTWKLLRERRLEPDLFLHGKYIPLKITGRYREHVLAFAREHKNLWYIVAVPLYLSIMPENELRQEPGVVNWEDTAILLPETAPGGWMVPPGNKELFSEEKIFLSSIMKVPCPVFLKGRHEVSGRGAGVLAHISSLPGSYGTGDLGREAYDFARILSETGQTYWQILPFNPIGKGFAWSPYSSVSAFAGNSLFINPDLLFDQGLAVNTAPHGTKFRDSDRTNFKKAGEYRNIIFDEAYENFLSLDRPYQHMSFNNFCLNEKYWLDDFALFSILREEFGEMTWNTWPEKIRNRDPKTIQGLILKHDSGIRRKKFIQYLFQVQWKGLKDYCNNKNIKIIGDMSFYVNYDSAEVWSHPEYFKLDAGKIPVYVGGVPPDYFSETGQLWNMPVYNWEKMRRDDYRWWIKRIKRNLDLCDLVRFDHFRGFSEYWEVPGGETTAINGKWTAGPGSDFFSKIKHEFPGMPFIAEDLGTIDEKVYRLRDEFDLPGMAVLQFAFGGNTPMSAYIPHNHQRNSIVYTGTHDNNTIRGWFTNELTEKGRREAEEYTGHNITENSCHEDFIRMAYGSVARIAIIPLQDILGLDGNSRLNKPSTVERNWEWKLRKNDLDDFPLEKIRKMAVLFGRA